MESRASEDFLRHFSDLIDPRRSNRRYLLCDIILLAVAGVMCGCEGWQEVAEWTEDAFEFLGPLLVNAEHGCPSADTFRRVISRLSTEGFERCFQTCSAAMREGLAASAKSASAKSASAKFISADAKSEEPLEQYAIDGKTLRRSFEQSWKKTPLHLVSAFAVENRLILGQLKVDCKENEIVAIPRLLELLLLKKTTVTIDAMGCQKEIARQIVESGGDYLLAVKENQPALHEQVKSLMDEVIVEGVTKPGEREKFQETQSGHGRIETRTVWVANDVQWLKVREEWKGVRQMVAVESRRDIGGKQTVERRYFIASHKELTAERAGRLVRNHWSIENSQHWVLDVTFNEDQSRIRNGDGAENFARIRRIALNKLRVFKDPSGRKLSVRMKRKKCSWRFDYFLKVLAA